MFDEREPEKTELNPELAAVERLLSDLMPKPPRIDRDRLMFEAGRAAASRSPVDVAVPSSPSRVIRPSWSAKFWPAATAVMTAASLLLATMLVWQRSGAFVAQEVALPSHTVSDAAMTEADQVAPNVSFAWKIPPSTGGYLGTRYVALSRGVAALEPVFGTATDATPATPRRVPATARELRNELLSAPGSTPSRS